MRYKFILHLLLEIDMPTLHVESKACNQRFYTIVKIFVNQIISFFIASICQCFQGQ